MNALAAGLILRERRVLLVGAGPVAHGKLQRLLAAGARVTVVAPNAVADVHALAADGQITLHLRDFDATDVDGAFLCLTATGRDRVDLQVFAACEARQVLCNAADVPEACSVVLWAQEEAGPITFAVGSRGTAPGLTGRLAREARAAWPADIADLAVRYGALRRWLARELPGHERLGQRTAALRWLAVQPWPFLRQPEAALQAALLHAARTLPPELPR